METTPNLALPLLDVGQAQKELTVNEALGRLDALQAGILTRTLGTPPGLPAEGDCYIIGSSPTGAWSGLAGHLAYYLSGWRFLAPKAGMNLWVRDEGWLHYTGSAWQPSLPRSGRRNALLNGHFACWQRGTSFTATGYGADRWLHDLTGGAGTLSRQNFAPGQTAVAGEPAFFLRLQMTSGATAPHLSQKIEGVRTLAGQNATLSFFVRAAAPLSLTPALIQSFGTGGSSSSSVITSGLAVSVGTAWSRVAQTITLPGLGGKTIGTNGDDFLQLKFPLPPGTALTFDLAQVQLEAGEIATPFAAASLGEELHLCQRYYEPCRVFLSGHAGAASASLADSVVWKTEKRATPGATNLGSLMTSVNVASLALDSLSPHGGRYALTSTASGATAAGTLFGIDAEL